MKSNFKKAITVGLSVAITLMALSGCGSKSNEGPKKEVKSIATENGTFPIVTEPYTLKIFAGVSPSLENVETNEFTKYYEEKTGVKIQWDVCPSNGVNDKRKISLASRQYPDIYLGAGITKQEEMMYGSKGVFLELSDLIDKYSKYYKEAMADMKKNPQLADAPAYAVAPGNKIYSFSNFHTCLHSAYVGKIWINKKWLDALNLKVPTTTDEYYEVLKAFKEKDPNGNGKKDEIPFYDTKNEDSYFAYTFANSFGQTNKAGMFVNEDGKVDTIYNKDAWKQTMAYLRKLVSEKLIDETSFSATSEQAKAISGGGDVPVVGSFISAGPDRIFDLSADRHKDMICIDPLKGPEGNGYSLYVCDKNVQTGRMVITSACEHPEVAVRWVDWFYSTEGYLRSNWGKEGEGWIKPKDGQVSYTGGEALWAKNKQVGKTQNFSWKGISFPQYGLHDKQVGDKDIYSPSGLETRLYDAVVEHYVPHKPENNIPDMYVDGDALKEVAQPLNDLTTYIEESIVRFATGDLDVEKDWDKFVKNIDSIGINDILKVYQTSYDNFTQNLDAVRSGK